MATAPHTLAPLAEICQKRHRMGRERAGADPARSRVYWCDGSHQEFQRLRRELISKGELLELNPGAFPNCCRSRVRTRRTSRGSST